MSDEKLSWETQIELNATQEVIDNLQNKKITELEKKVEERGDNFKIYNAYTEINERIEKLEKLVGSPNFYKQDIGTNIDRIDKELSELREQVLNSEEHL